MQGTSDESEKSHDPSEKKLRDARKRGEIARSADLNAFGAYLGLWLGLTAFGGAWVVELGSSLSGFLGRADTLAPLLTSSPARHGTGLILRDLAVPLLAWAVVPMLCVTAAVLAQNALVFAPSRLAPRANRLSPLANARQKYGSAGLFEFVKSLIKLFLYALCLGLFLRRNMDAILGAARLDPGQIVSLTGRLGLGLLAVIVGVAGGLATVDYLWQRSDFLRRQRMSHKEMRDEHKDSEGDPTMKAARRARAQEIAMNSMLADVPRADVVIVNPTHYAVALEWDGGARSAPVCVAKGVDEVAARIRALAVENGVPVHSDPPTARALFAGTEVGTEIDPALYAPVAAAIRFAEQMRDRARRGGL